MYNDELIKVELISKLENVELYKLHYQNSTSSIIPEKLNLHFIKTIEKITNKKPYTILNTNPQNVFVRILVVGIVI